jgi:hypothetical protein
MNIILPSLPDREALLGFRVSLALLGGAGAGVVAFLSPLGTPGRFAVAGGAALLLFLITRQKERATVSLYLLWDRATKAYAERARGAITMIWYWSVFAAVARTGQGSLRVNESDWRARGTLSPEAYTDPGGAPTDREGTGGARDLARWAVRTGRPWTLVLVPLLALLRALETRGRTKPVADIYTLY